MATKPRPRRAMIAPHPSAVDRNLLSRPFFTQKVTLQSLHAQQLFDRGFDICADAVFSLTVVLRIYTIDKEAREVEGVVDERINASFEEIRAEVARLEKVAEANGIEFTGVAYSNPREVAAIITSPRAVRYLAMIREFDDMVGKLDTLWLSSVIDDSTYSASLYDWKRRLLRLSGSIRTLALRAIVAAKRRKTAENAAPPAGTEAKALTAPTPGADGQGINPAAEPVAEAVAAVDSKSAAAAVAAVNEEVEEPLAA